jgi:hypothetical protein
MSDRCYWCGERATGRDHIPPKGFYPPGTRNNLITVPACVAHNQGVSAMDERMRFFVQSVAENAVASTAFEGATVRGMISPRNRAFLKKVLSELSPATLDGTPATSGKVDAGEVEIFSERLARGLHFRHYGELLRGRIAVTNTHFLFPNRDNRPGIMALEEMVPHLSKGDVTNPCVFEYCYGKTVEPGGNGFLLKAQFYRNVTFYVLALDLTTPLA